MERCEWCGSNYILCNMSKMNMKNLYCKTCIIKALLLVNPINFDKEFMFLFFETLQENDKGLFSNVGKFSEWVKPILEYK